MNKSIWLGSLVSLVAVTVASVPAAAQQPKKPNVVVILADNLGYGELGIYGGGILRGAPTPRIDALAGEGMRLLNFNVEAQCTPSRSALLAAEFFAVIACRDSGLPDCRPANAGNDGA